MTKAAFVLIALLISTAAHADIYRCTVNGETQYTDHPCAAAGEKVSISKPDNSNRDSRPKPPDIPRATGSRANAGEDARTKAEARRREVETEFAKREQSDLWKRRNMSVSCFTEKYNIWVSGKNPRPTKEESDRKIDEVVRECREIYRIPQDVSSRATQSPQK